MSELRWSDEGVLRSRRGVSHDAVVEIRRLLPLVLPQRRHLQTSIRPSTVNVLFFFGFVFWIEAVHKKRPLERDQRPFDYGQDG